MQALQMNNYFENQVLNASPLDLVIMLYNKAIYNLKQALSLFEKKELSEEEVQKKVEFIDKTIDILIYLRATLNFEKGKEIAKNLDEIYDVLIKELMDAQIHNNKETIEKIVPILEDLKSAWEDAKKNLSSKK